MIATTKLQHVGVYVADARQAADWYIKTMGFTEIGAFSTASGHTVIFVASEILGVTYEMVQHPAGSVAAAEMAGRHGHVDHLAYAVDDIEAAFAQAKREGEDIIEGIIDIPEFWDNGFRYFMIRAKGGERVEFCTVL